MKIKIKKGGRKRGGAFSGPETRSKERKKLSAARVGGTACEAVSLVSVLLVPMS